MNKNHAICLLNDSFPPIIDGVANVVVNYGTSIQKEHGKAVVVTPEVPGSDDSAYNFRVVRYPSIDTRKMFGYVTGYPFSPEAAHAAEEEAIELFHTHCPVTSCLLARSLAEAMNKPLVLTWHTKYDIDIQNAIKSKVLQEGALQALLRNVNACDEVWTVSRGAGDNLRSIGYEGEYIVMPNGVDLPRGSASEDAIEKATAGYDLPRDVPCFLFAGRLMWYKGLRIILDALDSLNKEGAEFRMVFAGGGGDEAEVRAYADSLDFGRKVIFTGPIYDREELRAWYSRADLLLFPSTFDTNGLVVREAAAGGTASVLIGGSCAAEDSTDGRNGFFIEENAGSLAAKLGELMKVPETVKKAGELAQQEIYISWSDAVARAYDRYGVVIDNYKSGVYGRRDPLAGSWMKSQGELMQILGDIESAGREIRKEAEDVYGEVDMTLRSMKNKMIVDAISATYEVQETIRRKIEDLGRE